MTTAIKIRAGFKKGWGAVKNNDMKPLRELIQSRIPFSSPAFYARMRGETKNSERDADIIEQSFLEYGYTDIWD